MKGYQKPEYTALLTEINNALAEKTNAAVGDRIILRDAVCAYAAAEYARGTSLELVIQSVKDILGSAEQGANAATDELARQIVDWCREFHRGAYTGL